MYKVTDEMMDTIVSYMADDIKKNVHFRFAPCSNEKFLAEYCRLDFSFAKLVYVLFGIDVYVAG